MPVLKSILADRRHIAIAMGLAVVACPLVQARAADLNAQTEPAIPPTGGFDEGRFGGVRQTLAEWDVIVGGGAIYAPKFEGSDEFEVIPIPMISATFGQVTVDPGGVSVDVLETDDLTFTLTGGYELGGGRKESDSRHLRGLGDIDPGGFVGGQASYELGPMEFYAKAEKTIGGSHSLIGEVGANVSHQIDRFTLSAGASATFADHNHMESYFSVTAAQSARSGLRQYDAGAGLKRFDIEASVTYKATENWFVRGEAGVGFLTGDAKDSPIVQTDVQPSATLLVGYNF